MQCCRLDECLVFKEELTSMGKCEGGGLVLGGGQYSVLGID